ncbi:FAD binding domain protein [Mycobacterium kansasii 824]|nr:FAD binding domain protein [Mycobacterium kansasii 824]
MKWNAWGDPAAAKPLSDGIRALLKQVVGLGDSDEAELDPDQVILRPSALSQADRDALAEIVGAEYFRAADRDRLLHAGGKSTPDMLRRKDTGPQDAPDAVLLPGDDGTVAAILRYCSDHGIAVVPFGGGTNVVGGLDPDRGEFGAVISLDLRRFNELHFLDEVSGIAELGAGATGPRPNACSVSTASRSGTSRKASYSPPSVVSRQPVPPARAPPAMAGSTT